MSLVPANYEKIDVGIATRISETMKRQIDAIAEEHDRKPAYIIRELLVRGLALYNLDGRLRDDAKPGVKAAEVVMRIEPGKELLHEKEEVRKRFERDLRKAG